MVYLELPNEPLDIFISGNYIYTLLSNDEGFYIINISDPLNPAIEGNCDLPEEVGQYSGIHVVGNYAYVAQPQPSSISILLSKGEITCTLTLHDLKFRSYPLTASFSVKTLILRLYDGIESPIYLFDFSYIY